MAREPAKSSLISSLITAEKGSLVTALTATKPRAAVELETPSTLFAIACPAVWKTVRHEQIRGSSV